MIIKIECPNCGQPIEFPDEMVGTRADCPGCWRKIILNPAIAAAQPAPAPEVIVPKVAAPAPKIEAELDDVGSQIYNLALVLGGFVFLAAVFMFVFAVAEENGSAALAGIGALFTALVIVSQGYILRLVFRGGGEGIRLLRQISEAKK